MNSAVPSRDLLLQWLETQVGFETYLHLKERGLELLAPFTDPLAEELRRRKIAVITVGGTNGKGQTSYFIKHLLERTQGAVVGLFTSPHITEVAERMQCGPARIPASLALGYFEQLKAQAQHLDLPLSYFEILFLTFLHWTLEHHSTLTHLILEVGVGGRLDATNTIDAQVAVITSISRDHQALLGGRYEQILSEKLGITRPGSPVQEVVTGFELQYLENLTEHYWQQHEATSWASSHWSPSRAWIAGFPELRQYLKGKGFVGQNIATALCAVASNQPEAELLALARELEQLDLPGRGERWKDRWGHSWQVFGSHNPEGLRQLVHYLKLAPTSAMPRVHLFAFSQRPFRDILCMVKTMRKYAHPNDQFYLLRSSAWKSFFPQQDQWEQLREIDPALQLMPRDANLAPYLEEVLGGLSPVEVLAWGSYYFIGDLFQWKITTGRMS